VTVQVQGARSIGKAGALVGGEIALLIQVRERPVRGSSLER
jgi:hypothetical protein